MDMKKRIDLELRGKDPHTVINIKNNVKKLF
jgi:hypothetical protein